MPHVQLKRFHVEVLDLHECLRRLPKVSELAVQEQLVREVKSCSLG